MPGRLMLQVMMVPENALSGQCEIADRHRAGKGEASHRGPFPVGIGPSIFGLPPDMKYIKIV